jgi:hypothetical protein
VYPKPHGDGTKGFENSLFHLQKESACVSDADKI